MDGCRDLARGNLQAVHFAEPLYEFLEGAAAKFPAFFPQENENRLRQAACHLAGIGKGLHPITARTLFLMMFYMPRLRG